ncbi:MAG: YfaZ family protein, partial [Gammaproteobacteria bacterium]|nr:YfaZ family protein [Gammaproteobacteria bacterium]
VVGTLGERRDLQFGVGAKAYGGDLDIDKQVLAIAIGGQARYVFQTRTPIGLVLEAYAAPGITSFGDTEGAREFNFRTEIEVLPSTRGYIGYRYLDFEFDTISEVKLDDNVHIGIRLQF